MGKSKCRKSRRRPPRPTGIPSVQELQLEEEEEELPEVGEDLKVIDIALDKLKSFSAEDKECGANIIAQRADNLEFATLVLKHSDGIRVIAPLLLDSSLSVRHAVCGCLRNLSASAPNAESLVEKDVMTPLSVLLQEYSRSWAPSACSKSKIDSKKEIFIQACNLLSHLCESSGVALEAFNQKDLIFALLPCLDVQIFGSEVTSSVLQCLHVVTENNTDAIAKIGQNERKQLQLLISTTPTEANDVQLSVLAIGVMLNLNLGQIYVCDLLGSSILKVLEQTLDMPILSDVEKIAEVINTHKEERRNRFSDPIDIERKFSKIVDSLTALQSVLMAKQVTLEILTNIFCTDGDDFKESDSEEFSDSEDGLSCEVEFEPDNDNGIPSEVRQFIVKEKILQKILQQIVIPSEKISKLLEEISEGRHAAQRLHAVRCRALLCINNMVQGLSIEELGGISELFQLWLDLSIFVFSQTKPTDDEQVEAATSPIRAVLQKLSEVPSAPRFSNMTENDLELYFSMWKQCAHSGARVNIIRSVATIACILVNMEQPNAYTLIKIIGTFLIEVCTQSSELWVMSEALDAIFDVFAEDHLDFIAQEISLVDKLKQLRPLFKEKVKHRNSSEHEPVITTARTNLWGFLKYKEAFYKAEKKNNCT